MTMLPHIWLKKSNDWLKTGFKETHIDFMANLFIQP